MDTNTLPGTAHQPLPEAIYQWLHEAIQEGRLAPGQMLRQEELAKQLGVSRVPLREALQRLEGAGQVVLHPRRGYAVLSLDYEEIEEIFQLRMLLDERAAYQSTLARTPERVAELRQLLEQMRANEGDDEEQVATWLRLNSKFHDILLSAGKHRHLARVAKSLRDTVQPYIRMEVAITRGIKDAHAEHVALVDAFARGDAYMVARITREHCEHTAQRLIEGLKKKMT